MDRAAELSLHRPPPQFHGHRAGRQHRDPSPRHAQRRRRPAVRPPVDQLARRNGRLRPGDRPQSRHPLLPDPGRAATSGGSRWSTPRSCIPAPAWATAGFGAAAESSLTALLAGRRVSESFRVTGALAPTSDRYAVDGGPPKDLSLSKMMMFVVEGGGAAGHAPALNVRSGFRDTMRG
jgi:hypothetical protein